MNESHRIEAIVTDPATAALIAELMARQRKLERRLRITWSLAALGAVSAFVLSPPSASLAQTIGITLTSLNTRLTAVEAKTASMSTLVDPNTNVQTVRFSAVNLQVVNGSGNTSTVNTNSPASGNVIIGYNETGNASGDNRTGYHNLIVGLANSYGSYSDVVFGYGNLVNAPFANVTGGDNNIATGEFASVTGGGINQATYAEASVTGGAGNVANGLRASVTGGASNQASQQEATVTGGLFNTASGIRASVNGGTNNNASAYESTVSGGAFVGQGNTTGWSGGGYHTP